MKRPLKVLVLSPDFPPSRGGIQVLVHRVMRHARELDPLVLTIAHPGAREFDAGQPFVIHRLPVPFGVRQGSVALINARGAAEALRFAPDVILSAHIVTAPAASLIRRLRHVPVVQYLYAKEVGAKPPLARYAVRHADTTIVISRYTESLALSCGARPESLRLVPPGMDLPAAEPPADDRVPAPVLLTVARLEDRYKGHDVITRALPLIIAQVPQARWVVIGDGPLRRPLEELAAAHGVRDRVDFLGAVDDATRDGWLRRAAVFVMPSRLPAGEFAGEGFGIVYLEAAARGLPVVAGNVAGAVDAVDDGRTGTLVDPASHLAVATAVTELLTDTGKARRFAAAGPAFAREFAWERIAARVEEVLYETAAAGARAVS